MLNASRKYKLRGWVYIEDGSTITIPAGTVIRGDKQTQAALIIERGGQIFARGTASKPIVFTSEEAPGNRRPGDWGGLILCGRASNNKGEQQIEGGPRSYHGGGSNPVDTNSDGSDEEPYTTARFCNVTLIGPMGQDAAFYNQSASTENPGAYINAGEMFPNNGSGLGQFQAGVQIRRNSRISLYNSIVTGWPVALMIEKDKGDSPAAATAGLFEISNVHFSGYDKALESFDNTALDPDVGILSSDQNKTRFKGNGFTDGRRQRCRERFVHGSFRLRRLGQRFRRRLRNRRELDGRMDQLRSAEHGILIAPSAARRPLIGKPHSGHRPLCGLPFRRESGKRPNVSIPDAEVRPDSQDINSESLYPVTTATSRPDTRSPVPLEVPELG